MSLLRRFFTLSCIFLSLPTQAAVIEWVGHGSGKPPERYLAPPQEDDKYGGLFLELRYHLAKAGHTLVAKSRKECGKGDILIFLNICSEKTLKRIEIVNKPTILLNFEPPINDPLSAKKQALDQFTYVLTWNDHLVDDQKFLRMYYPSIAPQFTSIPSFSERKLCCLINTNLSSKEKNELYSKRLEIAQFYDQMKNGSDFFDLFGQKWDKAVSSLKPSFVENKLLTIQNYRFCFAYENWQNSVSYITEKIFDCFTAGTIPIYLGSSTITKYVPKGCFIDARDFQSIKEIHNYILHMDEETWNQYQKNIQAFLHSSSAQVFTNAYFIEKIIQLVSNISCCDSSI